MMYEIYLESYMEEIFIDLLISYWQIISNFIIMRFEWEDDRTIHKNMQAIMTYEFICLVKHQIVMLLFSTILAPTWCYVRSWQDRGITSSIKCMYVGSKFCLLFSEETNELVKHFSETMHIQFKVWKGSKWNKIKSHHNKWSTNS